MSVVEVVAEIDAPIEVVWRVVADPRNLPRWDKHIVGVENPPPDGLRTGCRYTTIVGFMGVRAHVGCLAEEVRTPEYSMVRLHGLLDAVVETTLERLGDDRTRLRHHVDYRFLGGPLGAIAAKAVNVLGAGSLLRHGVQAQKRQAEEDAQSVEGRGLSGGL